MPRKLDPQIGEVLKKYGYGAEACWDCHGTWVIYHKVLEQIAVKAGIKLDPPQVLEANGKDKTVALCVTGHLGEASVWSIGEASPHNYIIKGKMQAYPYAMAEKRGIDRVVLKLIGLHGIAYSEEESDDFVPPPKEARDIAYGVGAQAASTGQLDLMSPWGEVEEEFIEPMSYLSALALKLEEVGAYFPSNEHIVKWIGETIQDEKVKKEARNVWKLGRDAWAQSPDNPKNQKPKDATPDLGDPGRIEPGKEPEPPEEDPARLLLP